MGGKLAASQIHLFSRWLQTPLPLLLTLFLLFFFFPKWLFLSLKIINSTLLSSIFNGRLIFILNCWVCHAPFMQIMCIFLFRFQNSVARCLQWFILLVQVVGLFYFFGISYHMCTLASCFYSKSKIYWCLNRVSRQ